jgi:site-specific recombinase XerD
METYPISFQNLVSDVSAYLKKMSYPDSRLAQFRSAWKRVAEFMEEESLNLYTPAVGDAFIHHLIGDRKYEELSRWDKEIVRCTNMLTEFTENGNVKFSRGKKYQTFNGPIGQEVLDFISIRKTLGISNRTLDDYKYHMNSFIMYLGDAGVTDAGGITRSHVLGYASELGFRTEYQRHRTLGIVRNFLRHLYDKEIVVEDISKAVPKDRYVRQPDLPSTYTEDEINAMLRAVDRGSPKGKRDYAMLLVTSRLGLRAGDVCGLQFTNIAWEQNLISLNQGKTGKLIELPLLIEIGEAIIDYLKYGRPPSELPYVFLHVNSPYDRLCSSTLHSIVCQYLRKAGIHFEGERKHGPHALRHSLVGILLEKKTPVPVISEVLGHKNTESTKTYLRIDVDSLRQCALDVPPVPDSFYERMVLQ